LKKLTKDRKKEIQQKQEQTKNGFNENKNRQKTDSTKTKTDKKEIQQKQEQPKK
jgi:hypothetical protein